MICLSIATNKSALMPPLYVANQKAPLVLTAEAAETDCRLPGTATIGVSPLTPRSGLAPHRHESRIHPRNKSPLPGVRPVPPELDLVLEVIGHELQGTGRTWPHLSDHRR